MNTEEINISVGIMANSTFDIGPGRVKAWGVTLVPLKVLFGEGEFLDGMDMQLEEFCQHLMSLEELPTTNRPDPEAFLTVFQETKKARDDVVVTIISSNLGGTFQSATIVKEMYEYDNIYIVDSMQVTCTALMMVRRDPKLTGEGKSGRGIYKILEAEESHYYIYATVDDLTYLEKGGRLSKVGATAGSMLSLKPAITIASTSAVKLAGMTGGQHDAYARMSKLIESDGGLDFDREMYIGYTGDMDVSVPFKEYLKGKMDISGFVEGRVGTVIDTHSGSGCAVFGTYLK